jgi:hypothetical protein
MEIIALTSDSLRLCVFARKISFVVWAREKKMGIFYSRIFLSLSTCFKYGTHVHYSLTVNIAEVVAQLQEKSLRIFDFESEVFAGQGVAIFENRMVGGREMVFCGRRIGDAVSIGKLGRLLIKGEEWLKGASPTLTCSRSGVIMPSYCERVDLSMVEGSATFSMRERVDADISQGGGHLY